MTERTAFYTVDRIEGAIAVLVGDDGDGMDVPARAFALRLHEGVVLRVRMSPAGAPDWPSAEVDLAERERRVNEARATLERLRRSDPGGDVVL